MPSGKEIRAGKGHVELGLQDKTQKGLNQVAARFKRFGGRLRSIGLGIAGAGAAVLAPMVAMTASFAQAGDAAAKSGRRLGISAGKVQALQYATARTGGNVDGLTTALFRMNRRIANVTTEAGPAKRAIEELGLDADKLNKLPVDKQLLVIADALNKFPDKNVAKQLGFEILGKSFQDLAPLINEGADGITELTDRAAEMGILMDDEQAAKAEAMADAMLDAKLQTAALTNEIGAALAPAIIDLLKVATPWIKTVMDWIKENQALVKWVAAAAAGVVAFGGALVIAGGAMSLIGGGIAAIAPAVAALVGFFGAVGGFLAVAGPVILIVAAIVAVVLLAGYAALKALGMFDTFWRGAKALFWDLAGIARQTFGGIVDALMSGQWKLAAMIAWTGIRTAFLRGLVAIEDAFEAVVFRLGLLWFEMAAGLKSAWADAMHWIVAEFFKGVAKVNSWIKDNFGFDVLGSLNIEAILTGNDARRDATKADAAESVDAAKRTLDHIREARGETFLEKQLRESSAKLDELTAEAAAARNKANTEAKKKAGEKKKKGEGFDLEDFLAGEGDADTASRQAVGAFSAAAAARLSSAGGVQSAQQAAINSARYLSELARLARRGRLVFH